MSKFFCDQCERDFFNSNEFSRYQMIYIDQSSHKHQRKIDFYQIEFLNVEKKLYVQKNLLFYLIWIVSIFMKTRKKKLLQIYVTKKSISLNFLMIEKKLYIHKKFIILLNVFSWNNHIYEKMTDKKIDMIIVIEHEQNLSREKNTFFIFNFKHHSFNDEKTYALVLWFFENECIKKS